MVFSKSLYEAEADYSVSAQRLLLRGCCCKAASHPYFFGYSFHQFSFSPVLLCCRFGSPKCGLLQVYHKIGLTHLQRICALFKRLAEAQLTIHLVKCDFAMATVTYLGRVVGQGCVAPAQVFGLSGFCCIDFDYLILICLLFQQRYRSEMLDQRATFHNLEPDSSIKSQEDILDLRISSKM